MVTTLKGLHTDCLWGCGKEHGNIALSGFEAEYSNNTEGGLSFITLTSTRKSFIFVNC